MTKNDSAIAATILLSNARIAGNNILYKEDSGFIDKALNVKSN